MRIDGLVSNVFDLDVIRNEVTHKLGLVANEEPDSMPLLAKHFLVLMFTNWGVKNCPKFSAIAARYATLSLDAFFT